VLKQARRTSFAAVLVGLLLLLVISVLVALFFGAESISVSRVWFDPDSIDRTIVYSLRLPRVLLALGAGAALSGAGVSLQGTLRNPLAEPFVLGVSGGAALGACCALLLGVSRTTWLGAALLPLCALGSGLGATLLVLAFARGQTQRASLLLAGIAVNAIAASAITLLKTMVSAQKSQELLFWLTGFLSVLPSAQGLCLLFGYVFLGLGLLLVLAPRINLLSLGDDSAASLGIDVKRVTMQVLILTSLLTGAVVSLTGLIGFVGLIVPHLVRRVLGPDQRRLLPASALAGASLLVVCDTASRALFRSVHTEVPVGAITALLGGPAFLILLRKRRSSFAPHS
jgi:iron complex transport system permease protein